MENIKGKKYVVIGAGKQGLSLCRFLSKHGANIVLTDKRNEEHLGPVFNELKSINVELVLGEHPLSLLDNADFVCPSGGVPLTLPLIQEARVRGITLSNDSQVFLENAPCPVIGITGTAGKTTVTALVGKMAEAYMGMKGDVHKAFVGGNIGDPLLNHVDEMSEDDLAIMELSSFQLEIMTKSPQVACITNITPNHLDRHPNMGAYTAAKANIIKYQDRADVAVLNREDPVSWKLSGEFKSDLISFGLRKPESNTNATYVERDHIWLQMGHQTLKIMPVDWINLPGQHNVSNVLAAVAIAAGASIALPAIQSGVENFNGVPHRLEFVRTFKGADWYNDSIATAPEPVLAAIRAFDRPIVLLLGGRDKNLPWDAVAEACRRSVNRVILFGEMAETFANAIGPKARGQKLQSVVKCKTLKEAVKAAANQVIDGDVVLMSPGGTSFDEFKNFEERGDMYKKWVNALQ